MSLSARHLDFCRNVAAGWSMKESYIRAGYSAKTAHSNATRLMGNYGIKAEIERLKAKSSRKTDITLESMIEDMQKLHDLAIEKGDLATARGCKAEQIKLVGLYAPVKTENKTQVSGDMSVNTNQLEADTLQTLVAQKQKDKDNHTAH